MSTFGKYSSSSFYLNVNMNLWLVVEEIASLHMLSCKCTECPAPFWRKRKCRTGASLEQKN